VPKPEQLPDFWGSDFDGDLASFIFAEGFDPRRARETAMAFINACGSPDLEYHMQVTTVANGTWCLLVDMVKGRSQETMYFLHL
jgi:hypothetical protein